MMLLVLTGGSATSRGIKMIFFHRPLPFITLHRIGTDGWVGSAVVVEGHFSDKTALMLFWHKIIW